MAWTVLVISGLLEAVWANALAASDGFKKRRPTILFLISNVLSVGGLAWAMRSLPAGSSYAIWVGIGAATTAIWAIATGKENADIRKIMFLILLVACVVGLKVVS